MSRTPSLSTHVLNLETGQPASGLAVGLDVLAGSSWVEVCRATTDDDGRIGDLLAAAQLPQATLKPGRYRLSFDIASHFPDERSFLASVTLELEIRDVTRHYHVPLLMTRFSCASYRGS